MTPWLDRILADRSVPKGKKAFAVALHALEQHRDFATLARVEAILAVRPDPAAAEPSPTATPADPVR
jgi:hypothetical protein